MSILENDDDDKYLKLPDMENIYICFFILETYQISLLFYPGEILLSTAVPIYLIIALDV